MKRFFISLIVTPDRIRMLVARAISWLISFCIIKGAWDTISKFTTWLRGLCDFIDSWNATELTEDKDRLIADLVKRAITDDAVHKLIDTVSAMKTTGVCLPELGMENAK